MPRVRVPHNKSKAIKRLVLLVLLLVLFTLMVLQPAWFLSSKGQGVVKGVGYAGTLVSIFCAAFIAQRVFTRKPGLVIDEAGIADNSMNVGFAVIPWKEVKSLKALQISGDDFIAVYMKHPEAYIAAEPNSVKRKMLELNYASLQTPVNIAVSRLKMNAGVLLETLQGEWQKRC